MELIETTRREVLAGTAALLCPAGRHLRNGDASRLNFLVVGDWGRNGGDYQKHVARHMALEALRVKPRFILTTGDNFYDLGVSSETDSQWDRSFERIYCDDPLQIPWHPSLGNHDYGGNVFAQVKRGGRWQMEDRWYAVRGACYGQPKVDIFMIDTVVWQGREGLPYNLLGDGIGKTDQQTQKRWLQDALSASEATVKLVVGHHPIYSVGKHGGAMKLVDLDQMLRDHSVTAYINGHDHCLYHIRSRTMDYICSGGGSEELRRFTGDPKTHRCVISGQCGDASAGPVPAWLSYVDRAGFASFSVDAEDLRFELIDRSGVVFHRETIAARRPAAIVAPS